MGRLEPDRLLRAAARAFADRMIGWQDQAATATVKPAFHEAKDFRREFHQPDRIKGLLTDGRLETQQRVRHAPAGGDCAA